MRPHTNRNNWGYGKSANRAVMLKHRRSEGKDFDDVGAEREIIQKARDAGIVPEYGTTQGPTEVQIPGAENMLGGGGGLPTSGDLFDQEAGQQELGKVFKGHGSFNVGFTDNGSYNSIRDLKADHPDSTPLLGTGAGDVPIGSVFTVITCNWHVSIFMDSTVACCCEEECSPYNRTGKTNAQLVAEAFENPGSDGYTGGLRFFIHNFTKECCAPCQGYYTNEYGYESSLICTVATRSYSSKQRKTETFWVAGGFPDRDTVLMAVWDKMKSAEKGGQAGAQEVARWTDSKKCPDSCEGVV